MDAINPAQHMRIVLSHLKPLGVPFDEAWERGLRTLPNGTCDESRKYIRGWKAVLRWAKPTFREAYSVKQVDQNTHADAEDRESESHLDVGSTQIAA